ncbi:sugar phosphate nucleotidyltransferase, partial [Escherichia coli]|nr:sugar phosphate nucleotidyltransferase [Escherichia coli]
AADHIISKADVFCDAIQKSKTVAEQGNIVTFGIIPEYAETGYGYIKKGDPFKILPNITHDKFYHVQQFIEKPNHSTAEEYVST